jgi:hypothetical protein
VVIQRMVVACHACPALARPPSKSCQAAASSLATPRRRRARSGPLLDSVVHPDSGIASLSIALGHVATGLTRRITG